MHIGLLDWIIIIGVVGLFLGSAVYLKKYTRSVADFLAADRCAGRYLVSVGQGMSLFGVTAMVANFEKFFQAGFGAMWWEFMLAPVGLIVAMSGWVVYRFRATRALTLAQFFEMRYTRRFRIMSGMLGFVSGLLNYGVFPGIVANVLIQLADLPAQTVILGLGVDTRALVMLPLMLVPLLITLYGGMITCIVTNFLQGMFMIAVYVAITLYLLKRFDWAVMMESVSAAPAGASLLDPFDQKAIADFNIWFFLIFTFKAFYNCLGWQNAQGFNAAATSPHEARMASVLSEWRRGFLYIVPLVIPICAYAVLHHAGLADLGALVQSRLGEIGDAQIRSQMTVPVTLAVILPTGLLGLFIASIIGGSTAADASQLHSWGSIFIQDVVLPLRKKPFTPAEQLRCLRLAAAGVALFAYLWSLFFPMRDHIFMYFLITGTIYLGGSGAVIIGGLYWRRATVQGAWTAMITGAVVALLGVGLQTVWPSVPFLLSLAPRMPLNGAWLAMVAYAASIAGFVAVSLATSRGKRFDLDLMLGRTGAAGVPETAKKVAEKSPAPAKPRDIYTREDRWTIGLKVGWTTVFTAAFVIGTALGIAGWLRIEWWRGWWGFTVLVSMLAAVATVAWFVIGGRRDLRRLFTHLRTASRDEEDNGTVDAKK
ncbi:MAG: sodium:solute symporter [Opitutaceae bacterium]|jgi:SSS family solute:Na+ symporter|nr:sodium:solute symporter [Opitutaceae bacterium]